MKEGSARFQARAEQALRAAEAALEQGGPDFAAARAYYAMLYAAKALLNEVGLRLRAHAAIRDAFGRHYSAPGKLDERYHRWLGEGLERRSRASEEDLGTTCEEAARMIDRARRFVDASARHLDGGS